MGRAIVVACLPWLGLLIVGVAAAAVVVRLNRARPQFGRLLALHRDQGGAAQSLAFVITLPVFIWLMLFIAQMADMMVAAMGVNFAAYAAARAATVWIPARIPNDSIDGSENCISTYQLDPDATQTVPPTVDSPDTCNIAWSAPATGPTAGGTTLLVDMTNLDSPKVAKIRLAAAMALAPVSPARNLGITPAQQVTQAVPALQAAYNAINQSNKTNPTALQNKLAYAYDQKNTVIEMRVYHANSQSNPPTAAGSGVTDNQPPLQQYGLTDNLLTIGGTDPGFYTNEIGFQDPITVKVTYLVALIPGVGKLLAKNNDKLTAQGSDYYTFPLSASCTLPNEGEINGIYDP